MTPKEMKETKEIWMKKLIENAIKNQLYQFGHITFKGDYNPKLSIPEEAEIVFASLKEQLFDAGANKDQKELVEKAKKTDKIMDSFCLEGKVSEKHAVQIKIILDKALSQVRAEMVEEIKGELPEGQGVGYLYQELENTDFSRGYNQALKEVQNLLNDL
jgi:hypothetical protein